MKHSASSQFWVQYRALPPDVRDVADKCFRLLKADSFHPSLHFKKLGRVWSVRIGLHYLALAVEVEYLWVWIGSHAQYDKMHA